MDRAPSSPVVVLVAMLACGPSAGTEGDGSGGGSATSGSVSGTEDASASSTAAPTSADGSTGGSTTAAVDDTGSTGSSALECEPVAEPPRCEQTECSQQWEYACPECEISSTTIEGCFWSAFQCDYPRPDCALEAPCPNVFAYGDEDQNVLSALFDESAAICVLEALRDGVPGVFTIEWGLMFDCCWTNERVYALGDGTVVVDSQTMGFGNNEAGIVGRTGVLPLQPTSYFDDCLADPSAATLIDCLVGMVGPALEPVPAGYVPPFSTGECVSLDFECP